MDVSFSLSERDRIRKRDRLPNGRNAKSLYAPARPATVESLTIDYKSVVPPASDFAFRPFGRLSRFLILSRSLDGGIRASPFKTDSIGGSTRPNAVSVWGISFRRVIPCF